MEAILESHIPPHEPRHHALAQGRPGIRIRPITGLLKGPNTKQKEIKKTTAFFLKTAAT